MDWFSFIAGGIAVYTVAGALLARDFCASIARDNDYPPSMSEVLYVLSFWPAVIWETGSHQ